MMFIKLTNASPDFDGKAVVINAEAIVSVFSAQVTRRPEGKDEYLEDITFVHCPPHGTWEVRETLDQIYSMIKK